MNNLDAAWLAGLIDGEGTIILERQASGRGAITPCINIQMTCHATIAHAEQVMIAAGATGTKLSGIERNPAHKAIRQVRVRRLLDLLALRIHVAPYAVTKRIQWELLGRFIQLRLVTAEPRGDGRVRNRSKAANTEAEWTLYAEMKLLNAKGRQ